MFQKILSGLLGVGAGFAANELRWRTKTMNVDNEPKSPLADAEAQPPLPPPPPPPPPSPVPADAPAEK